MGKSKKRSGTSSSRSNPIGKLSKKNETLKKTRIEPLLEKLNSVIDNDRLMSLSSISVLCEDPYMRNLLLKEKLIQTIMTKLLNDNNTEIVVESFGLLRNLSLEEGYDVSTYIWRMNIWTSIRNGFEKIKTSLASLEMDNDKSTTESKRLLFDFADNLLSLLVSLTNNSDDILKNIISKSNLDIIYEILISLLKYGGFDNINDKVLLKIPSTLFNSILDLIYDFGSESVYFTESINNEPFMSDFIKLLPRYEISNCNKLSNVLIQGIILQFLESQLDCDRILNVVDNVVQSIQSIDLNDMNTSLSLQLSTESYENKENKDIVESIKEYTKKRNDAMMKLQSIEISIDLITASLELIATKLEQSNLELSENFIYIVTKQIPSTLQILSSTFKSRVLLCWNNLLWLYLTLKINIFEFSTNFWDPLWNSVVAAEDNEQDPEMVSIRLNKLSVIWVIIKTIQQQSDSVSILNYLQIFNDQFVTNTIQEFYNISNLDPDEIFELKYRCCNILGTLAMFPNQIDVNRRIGKFFIEQLCEETTDSRLLIEIINLVFDIYGDKSFDYDYPVFITEGFLNILKENVMQNLKVSFKLIDKNKQPELKQQSHHVFTTLQSFIKYKENEHM